MKISISDIQYPPPPKKKVAVKEERVSRFMIASYMYMLRI